MQEELFATRPEPHRHPPIWESAGRNERAAVVRALARLMTHAVRPKTKGDDDER